MKDRHPEAIQFAQLSIGSRFRFESEWSFPSLKTGVAVKTGARGYRYDDGMVCVVGSQKVLVVKEKEAAQ